MTDATDMEHIVWLLYRQAIQKHLANDTGDFAESEAKHRERAEKAGLVAVVNFIAKAYREAA